MKTCNCCKQEKPNTSEFFYPYKTRNNTLAAICITCAKKKNKEYYHNNTDRMKEVTRQNREKKKEAYGNTRYFRDARVKYGISKENYTQLWGNQGGRCKICENDLTVGQRPHIDHCHKTGKVRGLLCHNCNRGLGAFKDNPDFLLLACDYLLDFQETLEKL